MKKPALLLAGVMTVSLALVPLTACGNSGKLDLADYAMDFKTYSKTNVQIYDYAEYTGATFLDGDASMLNLAYPSPLVKISKNDTYRLYNIATRAYVGTTFDALDSLDYALFTCGTVTSDTSTHYYVYAPDGTEIVAGSWTMPSVSFQRAYIDGNLKSVYLLTYGAMTKYFTYEREEWYGDFVLREHGKNDITSLPVDHKEGDTLDMGAMKTSLDTDLRKDGLDGYAVSTLTTPTDGTLLTFYKNGKKKGDLSLKSSDTVIGYVGTNLFYSTMTPVESDATKGYNVAFVGEEGTTKFNVSYYRYDLAKNKTHSVDTNFYLADVETLLYNYEKEDFDAAVVASYPFNKNGVAVISEDEAMNETSLLILNEKGKVVMDATESPIDFTRTIVELKNDRYLVRGTNKTYIVNAKHEIIASLNGTTAYINATVGGVLFSGENVGMIDYDGKVVLEDKYSGLIFYGDKAASYVLDGSEEEMTMKIVSLTYPYTLAASVAVNASSGDRVNAANGVIVKVTATGVATLYNYSGAQLTTFAGAENTSISTLTSYNGARLNRIGEKYCVVY